MPEHRVIVLVSDDCDDLSGIQIIDVEGVGGGEAFDYCGESPSY